MKQITRVPSFYRAFSALFVKEIQQGWKMFCLTLLAILSIILRTHWNLLSTMSRHDINSVPNIEWMAFSSLIPLIWVLIRGFGRVRNEFYQNTYLLLKSLPASGFTIMFAKFSWIWLEGCVLSALILGWALFSFGVESVGHRDIVLYLFKLFNTFSLMSIAISLFSAMVSQTVSRFKEIIFLLTYIIVMLISLDAINRLASNGWIDISRGIPLNVVVLSSILSILLLSLSGWLFDHQGQ